MTNDVREYLRQGLPGTTDPLDLEGAMRGAARRRRRNVAVATIAPAVLIVGLIGVAGGSIPSTDRLTGTVAKTPSPSGLTPPAASAARSPAGRPQLLARFEQLLRGAVQDRYSVTMSLPVGDEASEADFPPRVSLALGGDGWVSLRTGSHGGDIDCLGIDECTEQAGPDGSRLITISRTAVSGARTNLAAVIRTDGQYVSATASDAVLDAPTYEPGGPSGSPLPLDRDELLVIALAASSTGG